MASLRHIFLALAALSSASPLAFAGDKGDTYVYTGLISPSYMLQVDSLTPENDKGDTKGEPANAQASSIMWEAESALAAQVGFSYKGFGAGTTLSLEEEDQQDNTDERATKVATTYTSYDLSYFFARAGIEVAYTDLKGMKISDTEGAASNSLDPEGPDTFRPDIRIRSKSANLWLLPLAYNLELDSFFDPARLSHGSGIGLLVAGSYDDLDLKMKRPLVSDADSVPFGADGAFMKGNFVTFSGMIGPAATLDFNGLYVSGMIAGGTGAEHVDYELEHRKKHTVTGTSEKLNFYVAAGYKGKDYFTTLDMRADSPSYRLNTAIISTTKGYVSLVLGKRF